MKQEIHTHSLVHTYVFEPQRAAVLALEEILAVGKATCNTTRAFRIVWTIEKGNVLIADVSKPVYLALVFEKAERDTVNGRIAPALVEEATSAVEVVEVVAILLASPEAHVTDFKVGPEVAG